MAAADHAFEGDLDVGRPVAERRRLGVVEGDARDPVPSIEEYDDASTPSPGDTRNNPDVAGGGRRRHDEQVGVSPTGTGSFTR